MARVRKAILSLRWKNQITMDAVIASFPPRRTRTDQHILGMVEAGCRLVEFGR